MRRSSMALLSSPPKSGRPASSFRPPLARAGSSTSRDVDPTGIDFDAWSSSPPAPPDLWVPGLSVSQQSENATLTCFLCLVRQTALLRASPRILTPSHQTRLPSTLERLPSTPHLTTWISTATRLTDERGDGSLFWEDRGRSGRLRLIEGQLRGRARLPLRSGDYRVG